MLVPRLMFFTPSSRSTRASAATIVSFNAICGRFSFFWASYIIFSVALILTAISPYIASIYSSSFSICASPITSAICSPVFKDQITNISYRLIAGSIRLHDLIISSAISGTSDIANYYNGKLFSPCFFSNFYFPLSSYNVTTVSNRTTIEWLSQLASKPRGLTFLDIVCIKLSKKIITIQSNIYYIYLLLVKQSNFLGSKISCDLI